MERRTKLVILALVSNENGEALLSRRFDPDFPEAHLKWDIPGGTNEWGEACERTAERETFEETGLAVEAIELVPTSVSKTWTNASATVEQHTVVLCCRCRLLGGMLATSDPKIAELRWVAPADIPRYDFLPTTRIFIDRLFGTV